MTKTRSFWPYGIICFFLVVFVFNFWFFYKAHNSNLGAVEDNTYEKSLNYQEVIDLKRKSGELGWDVDYLYQDNRLKVIIQDAQDKMLGDLYLNLEVIPLSYKGDASQQDLIWNGAEYVWDLKLRRGLYQLKLRAGEEFYDEYQLRLY